MPDQFLAPVLRDAAAAGLLLALTLALLGLFVVLRRVVLVGMAVAHAASAGVGLAFFLAAVAPSWACVDTSFWRHFGDVLCAGLVTAAAVLAIGRLARLRALPAEGGVGFVLCLVWATGVLLVSSSGQGAAEVSQLVNGDLLFVCPEHLFVIGAVAAVVVAWFVLFWKENVLFAFDPDMARALGLRPERWDMAFYLLLGLAVAAGTRFAGLLLVMTYLVVPALGGLAVARSVRGAALVAVASAGAGTVTGLVASFRWDQPAAPVIALTCTLLAALELAAGRLLHRT